MTVGITANTQQFGKSYLTVAEYKQAPTSIDYDNLVVSSTDPAVQDAELANVIARASSWIDNHCNQIIGATADTETQRVRLRNDGTIAIHPKNFPVIALTDLQYSWNANPQNLAAYPNCQFAWIEDQSILVPFAGINQSYSSQGPLEFGLPSSPRQPLFIQFSYVNGYANTILAVAADAGDASITVTDATGIVIGTQLRIYDGSETETVTVANTYTFGSTTVPIVSPLAYDHAASISVSALPPAIKQAAILVTTALLKQRGDSSMTMQVTNIVQRQMPDSDNADGDLYDAAQILKPFRRIR